MSSCLQETPDTSLFYIHKVLYQPNSSFSSLTLPTHYAIILRLSWKSCMRGSRYIIWINGAYSATSFLLYHTCNLRYSRICESSRFFHAFCGNSSCSGKRCDAWPELSKKKLCCLILLSFALNQHRSMRKGTGKPSVFNSPFLAFLSMFLRFQRQRRI